MNEQPVIMLQIADHEWTQAALHSACQIARNRGMPLVLVKMIPVQHSGWLGSDMGYNNLSIDEHLETVDYESTVEDYGLPASLLLVQYVTLVDATVQAAEQLNASIIFAKQLHNPIRILGKLQTWMLNRQLHGQGRQWIQDATLQLIPEPSEHDLAAETHP